MVIDDGRGSLGYLFIFVAKRINDRIRRELSRDGIHAGQGKILHLLLRCGQLSQVEVGRMLMIQPATITVLLQKLEQQGDVSREADPHDDRVLLCRVTEQGAVKAGMVVTALQRVEAELSRLIPESETFRERLTDVYERMNRDTMFCRGICLEGDE